MTRTRRRVIFEHSSARTEPELIALVQAETRNFDSDGSKPRVGPSPFHPISHVEDMAAMDRSQGQQTNHLPNLLRRQVLLNPISSQTSILQASTVEEVLPLLNGIDCPESPFDPFLYNPHGVLTLQRDIHVAFLEDALSQYPGSFVSIDASRPWMVYWALTPLHLLDADVSQYRDQVVKTFLPLQNRTGGYGGGQGHLSHLACTYPTILSLASVGGVAAWRLTDRKAMWEWLGRLKQNNGGFAICEGGEQDCRGAYCALVVISLLNLPWELPPSSPARRAGLTTFGDRLGSWLGQCQTYEGGISATPGGEAHGAYTFCAIACLCLLGRPDEALRHWLDFDALLNWLSARQYAPEGGLAGRTNKVVDGCYSHWIGGCWPLMQAALTGPQAQNLHAGNGSEILYSTSGLARYILNCCQNPQGGLRDKPSKRPDSYHSCYTLVGVSTIENSHGYAKGVSQEPFASVFTWYTERMSTEKRETNDSAMFNDDSNLNCGLNALHPVFVIPHEAVLEMRAWALQQDSVV